VAEESLRVDLWLWRARLFKTRAMAAAKAAEGRIRLTRAGEVSRIDKASRTVRPGDELVFAVGARIIAVRVQALGARRGSAEEARSLYAPLDPAVDPQVDNGAAGHR
jgi:ribosome-associated heat shock protein Hsp15